MKSAASGWLCFMVLAMNSALGVSASAEDVVTSLVRRGRMPGMAPARAWYYRNISTPDLGENVKSLVGEGYHAKPPKPLEWNEIEARQEEWTPFERAVLNWRRDLDVGSVHRGEFEKRLHRYGWVAYPEGKDVLRKVEKRELLSVPDRILLMSMLGPSVGPVDWSYLVTETRPDGGEGRRYLGMVHPDLDTALVFPVTEADVQATNHGAVPSPSAELVNRGTAFQEVGHKYLATILAGRSNIGPRLAAQLGSRWHTYSKGQIGEFVIDAIHAQLDPAQIAEMAYALLIKSGTYRASGDEMRVILEQIHGPQRVREAVSLILERARTGAYDDQTIRQPGFDLVTELGSLSQVQGALRKRVREVVAAIHGLPRSPVPVTTE